jgi:hypothetical protein
MKFPIVVVALSSIVSIVLISAQIFASDLSSVLANAGGPPEIMDSPLMFREPFFSEGTNFSDLSSVLANAGRPAEIMDSSRMFKELFFSEGTNFIEKQFIVYPCNMREGNFFVYRSINGNHSFQTTQLSTTEGINEFISSYSNASSYAMQLRDLYLTIHYNEMRNYQKGTKPRERFTATEFSQEEANESFRLYLANPRAIDLGLAFDIDVSSRALAENVIRNESKKSGMSYVLAIRSAFDIFLMAYFKKFYIPSFVAAQEDKAGLNVWLENLKEITDEPNQHNVIFEFDSSEFSKHSTLLSSDITNGAPVNLFAPYNIYQWIGARVGDEWMKTRVTKQQRSRHRNAKAVINHFSTMLNSWRGHSNSEPEEFAKIDVDFQIN